MQVTFERGICKIPQDGRAIFSDNINVSTPRLRFGGENGKNPLYEARRMATAVLAYLHAWDVLRMMVHQQSVGQPAPYLLVAAASEQNGAPNGTASPRPAPSRTMGFIRIGLMWRAAVP